MSIFSYRYLPLGIYVAYSAFLLMSLFIAPFEYKNLDYLILVSFISVLVFLFFCGYLAGARGGYWQYPNHLGARFFSYQRVRRLFSALLILCVISSVGQWFSFLAAGGELNSGSIGDNYVKGYEGYERGQARIDFLYVLSIFEQALAVLVLLFSFYYFKVMRGWAKSAFLFVVATYLLINVLGTGKQKYLGDVVIFAFFCMIINFAAKGRKFDIRTIGIFVLTAILVFFMFLEILRQRYLAAGIGLDNIYERSHPLISWDAESPLFIFFSSDYALALGSFLFYLTNGLYGLYLSLTLPFEWTYFVGNSYSLGRIIEIALSADGFILEQTYPYRVGVTYGWGFDKWHSLFAWIASDITFLGILFLTPLFSFFYARLWLQAIRASNPFAGPLFIYLSLGLIFSYANNQIMHSLAGVIVFVVLAAGWVLSRNLSYQYLSKCDISSCHEVRDE